MNNSYIRRILLAEPEGQLLASCQRIVDQTEGLEYVKYDRGDEVDVYSLLRQYTPDYLLIDMGMPKVDDIVLLKYLIQVHCGIGVMVVVNKASDVGEYINLGVKTVVVKDTTRYVEKLKMAFDLLMRDLLL